MVAAVLLFARGEAQTASEAILQAKLRRPSFSLTRNQRRAVERAAQLISQTTP
jgi:hypothetical protein